MEENVIKQKSSDSVEVRAFGQLKKFFKERGWPFPVYYRLGKECTALDLAQNLDLPADKIEAVFINGRVYSLQEGTVKAGDRIAFIPPGTPGPYRVMLGIAQK